MTITMKKKLFLAVLVAACAVTLTGCPAKYAVLLSSNEVIWDDVSYHAEWWYDLVLQYQMLKESGFDDSDIYVLYGDGTDFATVHGAYDSTALFGGAITDQPMNKAEVQKVFNTLNGQMKGKDYLYVWWMGHGSGGGADQCDLTMHISNTGETVTDDELRSYIDQVKHYRKRNIAIMTCHAGGLLDEFSPSGEGNVVLASSTCAESSYDATMTCNNIHQAEFNYTQPNGLRQRNPCAFLVAADTNGDGWVSLQEAHAYNTSSMSTSTPQLGDPDSLAASTVPARRRP